MAHGSTCIAHFWVPAILTLLSVACARTALADSVLIPPLPTHRHWPFAAALFVQEHGIDAAAYTDLARQLQRDAPFYLWAGLVDFPDDTPTAKDMGAAMSDMLSRINAAGFNGSDTRLLYVFGHGTGSFPMQDWAIGYVANQQKVKPYPAPLKGVVLLGSYLQRKHRNITYPTGVLSLFGDMDGVTRITRLAESYYHLILHQHLPPINYAFPHVALRGVSHMQFASGVPPPLIRELDLKPTQSIANATAEISAIASSFMALKLDERGQVDRLHSSPSLRQSVAKSLALLDAAVKSADDLLLPIIEAMELEAYHEFHPSCYQKDVSPKCSHGSPWGEVAQRVMCNLTKRGGSVNNTDTLWPVNEIFPHDYLPTIYNKCAAPDSCDLNTTSVTENAYDRVDEADESLAPIAATEQKVKLNSRQRCFEHAGVTPAEFNITDGGSRCAEINKVAYDYAVSKAFPAISQRFLNSGQPLAMAADKVTPVFPLWSLEPLTIDTSGDDAMVTSWASKFSTSNPIPLVSGLHFCKLLSPARAMEWVYLDGLRKHNSLQ